MDDLFREIIDRVVRYRESSAKKTNTFIKMKHNQQLCPILEERLNWINESFEKYHKAAYDVQGIHDRGTDILLKDREALLPQYVVFQVKSYSDLEKPLYIKTLKAQFLDALEEYKEHLERYYILLCTDFKKHIHKIREIKKAYSTNMKVMVVDPKYCYTFLFMNRLRIHVIVEIILKKDDFVFKEALDKIQDCTPTEIALGLAIVYQSILQQGACKIEAVIKESGFLRNTYRRVPDYPREYYFLEEDFHEETETRAPQRKRIKAKYQNRNYEVRLAEDLENLDNKYIFLAKDRDEVKFDFPTLKPIEAIMFDYMVRYDYEGDELLQFIFEALVENLFELEDLK